MLFRHQSYLDGLRSQQIVIFSIDLVGLSDSFSEAEELKEERALLATSEQHIPLAADRVPSAGWLVATPLVVPKQPLMVAFVVNKVQFLAALRLIPCDIDLEHCILREGIRHQEVDEGRLACHGLNSLLAR